MKRIVLISSLLIFAVAMFAQPSKRSAAKNYLGYGELDKAKSTIEQVIVHPKTEKDARAWSYRGRIYHAIFNIDNYKKADRACEAEDSRAVLQKLDDNPLEKSIESYKKALLYNVQGIDYASYDLTKVKDRLKFLKLFQDQSTKYTDSQMFGELMLMYLPTLSNAIAEEGQKNFNEKKYDRSLYYFEQTAFIASLRAMTDTFSIYYAAHSALRSEKYDVAKKYFREIIGFSYGRTDVDRATNYQFMAQAYKGLNDTVAYVKTLEKGIKKYPNSCGTVMDELINYYLAKGEGEKARTLLQNSIKINPNNKIYYFVLGNVYEGLEKKDSALIVYNKALEIDSMYLEPLFNIGIMKFNEGAELINQANDVPPTEAKKYKKLMDQAKAKFAEAKPFMEKVYAKDPSDKNTILSLKQIYYKLGMMDKYEEMDKKLKGE